MSDLVIEKLDKLEKLIIEMKEGNDERLDGIDERLDGIDARLDGIDARLDGIDKKLSEHDKRFEIITNKLLEHDNRLNNIEENMATKDDIRRIWTVLDSLVALGERHDTELLCINESIRRIEIKLDEHDKILKWKI